MFPVAHQIERVEALAMFILNASIDRNIRVSPCCLPSDSLMDNVGQGRTVPSLRDNDNVP